MQQKDRRVTAWTRWLKSVRHQAGLDQAEFAPFIGRSRSALAMYESGRIPLPADVVAAIRTAFPGSPSPPKDGELTILGQPHTEALFARIPYAGIVPASSQWGDPLSNDELREVDPKFAGPGRFMCRVQGDSCWPALWQGDLTIWEVNPAPHEGLIVLAERLNDQACTVKEYRRQNGRPSLCPVNPDYEEAFDPEGWKATAVLIGVLDRSEGPEISYFNEGGLRAEFLKRMRSPR